MVSETPVSPRDDPWYKAPDGFESTSPGTILRLRTAPGGLTGVFKHSIAAYNILFRTTDSNYQPSWAVTTLIVPQINDAPALLSYQVPYNSVDVDASPSNFLHLVDDNFWQFIPEVAQSALSRGWYFNIPDAEGPLAAFGDGITAGHATIDSIRAVLHAGFGLDRDKTRIALWGFSGGALASGFAAELQPHYAPELYFAGAALGGLPTTLLGLDRLSQTEWAGLIPQLLLGVTTHSPPANEYLLSQLKPTQRAAFLAARRFDIAQAFDAFAGQNIFEYFLNGRNVLEDPLIHNALASRGCMGYHGVPQTPLFIYKAIADEITPIEDADALVERWRNVGVNIMYQRNKLGNHLSESVNGKTRAMSWISTVLDGTYNHEGCTVTDVELAVPVQDSRGN